MRFLLMVGQTSKRLMSKNNLSRLSTASFLFLMTVLFQCVLVPSAQGQNISLENLGQVRVDQLSDTDVQSFITRMQSTGMSQQQLEQLASARGMSASEIAKLRRRIFDLRPDLADSSISRGRNEFFEARQDLVTESLLLLDTADQLKIYGLDLFDNSKLTFEPSLNLPTPKDYLVGPGDEIVIDVWGASEETFQVELSPEGFVYIPNLGPIYISGLTIDEASRRIVSRLSKIYAGLSDNAGTKNTYAQVTLGNLRSIKVHVVGHAKNPATFTLSSLATLFNALYYAGGPTDNGSLRQIDLVRNGETVSTLDAYAYLRGDRSQSIRLQDQDIIIVKPYLNRVILDGEIKQPAIYEAKEEETLLDILEFAGGFRENAYSHFLSVRRNTGREKTVATVKSVNFDSFNLKSGDEIYVESLSERFVNRVQIEGAVFRPGEFELTEGMKVSELIKIADGVKGDAFLGRGIVLRQNPDLTQNSLGFDVRKVINGEEDIELQNEDVVYIKSIFDLREEYKVTIEGEVKNPGEYDYATDMTVEDLILLADGLKESATKASVEVARRLRSNPGDDLSATAEVYNFSISSDLSISGEASTVKLQPFDLVIIRKDPAYEEQLLVELGGEVIYPGKYSIQKKNERISDLVRRAGGTTAFAYLDGATLIRRTEFYQHEDEISNDGGNGDDDSLDDLISGFGLQQPETNSDETVVTTSDAGAIRRQRLQELSQRDLSRNIVFKSHEFIGIDLSRIMANPGSKYDVILREGDIINIPRQLQTVRLRGELLYPITTRHDESYTLKDYITQAGGFSLRARKGKTYVINANGTVDRTKKFLFVKNYPKVEPGAEIFVPQRPPRRRLSAAEIASLASAFLGLVLTVNTVIDVTSN